MKRTIFISIGLASLILLAFWLTAQDVELIFSHKYHAEEVGAACTDCHQAAESNLATDNLLPDMESCYNCHDEDEACSKCHKDPDNAVEYPRIVDYIAKFPHDKHITDPDACEKCHSGVSTSDNIMDQHLPKMALCVDCHSDMDRDDYCLVCHAKSEDLLPADHKLNWRVEHGVTAGVKNDCQTCHKTEYCLECHQKDNLDSRVHPIGYVNRHGVDSKGNKENCLTCHEEQSFCVDCHQSRMVMPRNHGLANWSNRTTGGRHARAARLDLDSCLSCHSDAKSDPVCVLCHQI
ncbi:MAG TPA: hypothetical protein ENN22_09880 [bacterium]|nr:hypothetical protein [bacterium]